MASPLVTNTVRMWLLQRNGFGVSNEESASSNTTSSNSTSSATSTPSSFTVSTAGGANAASTRMEFFAPSATIAQPSIFEQGNMLATFLQHQLIACGSAGEGSSSGCSSATALTPSTSDPEIDLDAVSDASGSVDRSPRARASSIATATSSAVKNFAVRRSSFSVSQLLRKDARTPPYQLYQLHNQQQQQQHSQSNAQTPPHFQFLTHHAHGSESSPPSTSIFNANMVGQPFFNPFPVYDPIRLATFGFGQSVAHPMPALPLSATSAFTPVTSVPWRKEHAFASVRESSDDQEADASLIGRTSTSDQLSARDFEDAQAQRNAQKEEFRPLHLVTGDPQLALQHQQTGALRASPMLDASRMSSLDGSRASPTSTSSTSHSNSPNSLAQAVAAINAKCLVCDDKASGYHYGVVSCEGCKGFFRRTVQKNIEYTCHKDKTCPINRVTRNRCQACRFSKCIEMGMSRESVRQDRNRKRKLKNEEEEKQFEATARLQQIIRTVVAAHNENMSPAPLDPFLKATEFLNKELCSGDSAKILQFVQCVPGFNEMTQHDQMVAWQHGYLEILALRCAFILCSRCQSTVDYDLSRDTNSATNVAQFFRCVVRLCESFQQLEVFNEEIALLCAVCLLCPSRHGLQNATQVEKLQETLLEALRVQVQMRPSANSNVFAKLLMKLSDIRSLTLGYDNMPNCVEALACLVDSGMSTASTSNASN